MSGLNNDNLNIPEYDRDHIWHPFSRGRLSSVKPDNIEIVSGKGALLYDSSGTSYIDAVSSWWVNLHVMVIPYLARPLVTSLRSWIMSSLPDLRMSQRSGSLL